MKLLKHNMVFSFTKRKFTVCLFLLITFLSFAQPENPIYEEIGGKKYFVHFVQGGNTLYGLSKLYKVNAEDIITINPFVTNGLQIGQKILIPAEKEAIAPVKVEYTNPEFHVVQKSETLYGISKKYNITLDELVKNNPGVENGISIGQELKLPSYAKYNQTDQKSYTTQVNYTDSIVVYTVLPSETMYSISKRFMVSIEDIKTLNGLPNEKLRKGDVIKIPVKKEQIKKVEIRKIEDLNQSNIDTNLVFKAKSEYKIVYLLPFNLDGTTDQQRGLATEFLMGAQIALDSLEKLGFRATVKVLDANHDTTKLKSLLASKELVNTDLIIGPFTGKQLEITANWAKHNSVRMVSPLFPATSILKNNMYVYNAVNSDITLIEGLATYLAKNKTNEHIILIRPEAKDNDLYQAFRSKFNQIVKGAYKLTECSEADLPAFVKKSGNTILVVPSRDKIYANKFINSLAKSSLKNSNISIYATKEWSNNDDIRGFYKNKYNLHFASPNDFNFSNENTKNLLKKYRVKYNSDLSKYGTQGFDLSYYFIQSFLMKNNVPEGIMNHFNLKSLSPGSGYENKACYILKQENYDLIRVALINE
jgi:LysM repeat protein